MYEPVFDGDLALGYVAAGGYGHFVQQSLAYAYLPSEFAEPGTELTVEILGERRRSTVTSQPLYDPRNERLLS
jgi:glycine cleavage system aminomethyltransferase T